MSELHKKLVNVAAKVQYIQKKGWNSNQSYNYAQESDISRIISPALSNEGIALTTSVIDRQVSTYQNKKGNNFFLVTVKVEINFIDSETGEKVTIIGIGDGTDSGDKAIYKAITGAVKYVLMKTFLISTGDDPECDNKCDNYENIPEEKITSSQELEIKSLLEKEGLELDPVVSFFKIEQLSNLPSKLYDTAIDKIKNRNKDAK